MFQLPLIVLPSLRMLKPRSYIKPHLKTKVRITIQIILLLRIKRESEKKRRKTRMLCMFIFVCMYALMNFCYAVCFLSFSYRPGESVGFVLVVPAAYRPGEMLGEY